MQTLYMSVAIPKSEIAYLAARRGCILAKPVFLEGLKYPAGHVRYVNFSLTLNIATGLYEGLQRIEILDEPEDGTPGFDELPGLLHAPTKTPPAPSDGDETESEVADEHG